VGREQHGEGCPVAEPDEVAEGREAQGERRETRQMQTAQPTGKPADKPTEKVRIVIRRAVAQPCLRRPHDDGVAHAASVISLRTQGNLGGAGA
jgi:hypothetical protein